MSNLYRCDNPSAHAFHAEMQYLNGHIAAMHCEGYPFKESETMIKDHNLIRRARLQLNLMIDLAPLEETTGHEMFTEIKRTLQTLISAYEEGDDLLKAAVLIALAEVVPAVHESIKKLQVELEETAEESE